MFSACQTLFLNLSHNIKLVHLLLDFIAYSLDLCNIKCIHFNVNFRPANEIEEAELGLLIFSFNMLKTRQDKTRFYLYKLRHTGVQEDITNSHSI